MEMEEIYSFTISPSIVSRFAVQWSEDNHISIFTEKGIHILELIPSPMSPYSTIKFSRSFIYAPSIFPAENVSSKIEYQIWNMDREALYSFMMEESLTPKLSNVKEMTPKIINLAWSPQNLIYPSKCIIAILTSTGTVMTAFKISKNWYPAHDLSSMRYNFMEQEISRELKNSKNNSASFETLRNCIKALQATCFTWSKLFVDFAYFAVVYHYGDIVIFKIPRITDYNEILNPTIVGTIKLNERVKINALHWITINTRMHLIITGYFDGRIYGLKVKDCNEILELKSIEKYYDYMDRIPISAVRILSGSDANRKILIAKGNFVFAICFMENGSLKDMQHLQLEGLTISGMTCISTDYALVTTENGSMFVINSEENHFSKTKINNKLSQVHLRYLGLAHSLNSVIFINVTAPGTMYDHLVLKEPSKIHMFCLKNENWDPLFVLVQKKHNKFEQLWDCLEALRIKATRAQDPSIVLPRFSSSLESLSLHKLRIVMWTSVIMEICNKKKVVQGIGSITGEISDAQPLIFLYTACNYLTLLEGKPSLSKEEIYSMSLLKLYLEAYITKEGNQKISLLSEYVEDVLKKISHFNLNTIETCNLCGEVINDLSWKVTKCKRGHILPRCAITLLQITNVQYRICPICGLIFHQCLEHEFNETRCLFCDVPALQENRVLDSKHYVPLEKILSKPQSNVLNENQEMETVMDES
ncbi:unnamed protein product [Xylocopa violacea]|uniref:Transcription factor IIIC 90kDa subunit N-terminal domain-containing protein n=1 Tax=Xylocopa violacea TaxID=135666 RepID=A0ABP1N006_XYLVO